MAVCTLLIFACDKPATNLPAVDLGPLRLAKIEYTVGATLIDNYDDYTYDTDGLKITSNWRPETVDINDSRELILNADGETLETAIYNDQGWLESIEDAEGNLVLTERTFDELGRITMVLTKTQAFQETTTTPTTRDIYSYVGDSHTVSRVEYYIYSEGVETPDQYSEHFHNEEGRIDKIDYYDGVSEELIATESFTYRKSEDSTEGFGQPYIPLVVQKVTDFHSGGRNQIETSTYERGEGCDLSLKKYDNRHWKPLLCRDEFK